MTTIVLIQVKTVSHDVAQMTRLLYTVNALINNPNLFLEPQSYVSLTVNCISYSVKWTQFYA